VRLSLSNASCLRGAVYVHAAVICLMLVFPYPVNADADRSGDAFMTGFISSVLERELQWDKNSYWLQVVNAVATVTLFEADPQRQEAADNLLRTIDGLLRVKIVVKPSSPDQVGGLRRWLGITGEGRIFPTGDLFRPLIADPKQPQFFAGFYRFESVGLRYTMASVGFGETFGLYRFYGSREGDGLQLSLAAALFAKFNMSTPSLDLINADYTIGIATTYRRGHNSFRLRLYHESSHLGDELLQSVNPPERVNLSYEAIELIYSREWHGLRVYGGGEYLVHKEPDDLKPIIAHWGVEFRGDQPVVWNGRPIVGVGMKSSEENNWPIDTNIKAGLEFGHPNPGQRRLRLLAEWYKGYDPHGQFYKNKIEYYGLGVSLGF
jgi:hypothetical protein